MKSKCLTTPANSRLILVEDWMILACDGNHCAAMLLSFMIYWHDIRLVQVEKSKIENEIAEGHGDTGTQNTSLLQFHNERELELGLLGIYKARTIADALHVLTEKGFVERHTNPNPRYHFDRTRYFLLKPITIQHWLDTQYAALSRTEVDTALAPERERQKRRTDSAKMQTGKSHQQKCSTVKQECDVALQNRGISNEITTCDYSQDSLGDTHVPQTPSDSLAQETVLVRRDAVESASEDSCESESTSLLAHVEAVPTPSAPTGGSNVHVCAPEGAPSTPASPQRIATALADSLTPVFGDLSPQTENRLSDTDNVAKIESSSVSVAGMIATAKPKTRTKTKQTTSSQVHPAIQLFRTLTNRYPEKSLWPEIITTLGETPNTELLTRCFNEWVKRGWNKTNLAWLFEWYPNGEPTNKSSGGTRGNGTTGAISKYL